MVPVDPYNVRAVEVRTVDGTDTERTDDTAIDPDGRHTVAHSMAIVADHRLREMLRTADVLACPDDRPFLGVATYVAECHDVTVAFQWNPDDVVALMLVPAGPEPLHQR